MVYEATSVQCVSMNMHEKVRKQCNVLNEKISFSLMGR